MSLLKKRLPDLVGQTAFFVHNSVKGLVLCFLHDSLECLRVVHSEVGEHLAVDLDTCFSERTHQLAVTQPFQTCSGIDTLNPESAEVTFLGLTIAVSVLESFLPSVFGNCPYVGTATKIASCEAHDLLTTVTRSDVIY